MLYHIMHLSGTPLISRLKISISLVDLLALFSKV